MMKHNFQLRPRRNQCYISKRGKGFGDTIQGNEQILSRFKEYYKKQKGTNLLFISLYHWKAAE